MRFYFSGSEAIRPGELRDRLIRECPSRLLSCHGNYIQVAKQWLDRAVELGVSANMNIMLDSGAFTAWSLGHNTTLEQLLPVYNYMQQTYEHHFKSMVFINLDVIPGSRKVPPTLDQLDRALVDSDINLGRLQGELGDQILPVFHQGEPWERLDVILSQSTYMCLSPRQTVANKVRLAWLRDVAGKVMGVKNKIHGLATTGNESIVACDWFSTDSASWVISGGLGAIQVCVGGKIRPISVSVESPNVFHESKHFSTMTALEKDKIKATVDSYGFDVKDLSTSHEQRRAFNLLSVRDWANTVKYEKTTIQEGLF